MGNYYISLKENMSVITEVRKPYEFLARWNPDTGAFTGAHIQWYDSVLKDGVKIAGSPSKAYGVGEALDFPLSDIVTMITSDALALSESQAIQLQDLATAASRITQLELELSEYRAGNNADGVPKWVYKSQAYKSLILAGKMPAVKALLDSLPGIEGELARVDFETSARFYRDNPVLNQLATALQMTKADLDQIFITAATL
jgi:hypothetical protein